MKKKSHRCADFTGKGKKMLASLLAENQEKEDVWGKRKRMKKIMWQKKKQRRGVSWGGPKGGHTENKRKKTL